MRLFVLAASAAAVTAFMPTAPFQPLQQQRLPRTPTPAAATAAGVQKASGVAPLRMSSIFLDENALADRIKDGLLIRYLPEVRRGYPSIHVCMIGVDACLSRSRTRYPSGYHFTLSCSAARGLPHPQDPAS